MSPPSLPRRSTSSEQRRRRFFGLFGSQTPQPSAGRGTPPDEPQPRMVNFSVMRREHQLWRMIALIRAGRPRHLAEQAKEILGGLARDLLERNAAGLGQHLGGLDHVSRLVALAADTAGREIRRVGLDENAVGRHRRRDGAQRVGILEGQDAGEGNEVPERNGAAGEVGPAGKAVQDSGKAPCPVSSSRMRAMSSSASREWMTSGSPVSRAAAMWGRKPRSCASRGELS